MRVTVTNAAGAGQAGVAVTFSTTAGLLSDTVGGAATQSATAAVPRAEGTTLPVQTNANGVAEVVLTAAPRLGSAVVTAAISGGFRTSATILFVAGPPAKVALVINPTSVDAGGTATLQAAVVDEDNLPAQGVTVNFTAVTNTSGATLAAASAVTNANGQASVGYTAGAAGGTDTLRAAVGSLTATASIVVIGPPPPPSPASIELLLSKPQLDSGGVDSVTLTALVQDGNNIFLAGVPVVFQADSGGIAVTNGTTNASGAATALLSTAGDQRNRTIAVTATAQALRDEQTVVVTGTNMTISGASTLVRNGTTRLSIVLRDSTGTGIANQSIRVTSQQGNTIVLINPVTDFSGQMSVDVTATRTGNDTITATALEATATHALTISPDNFSVAFAGPPGNNTPEIALGPPGQRLRVHWDRNGTPQNGRNIRVFTTRGTLTDVANRTNTGTPIVVVTDARGDAFVDITAANAGSALVTAATELTGGPSVEITLEFVATIPVSLLLQASPTVLSVNQTGSEDQRSTIAAVVRDANLNPVKNQIVSFVIISDGSNGRLRSSQATTDSFGRASTEYIAGANASARDGVVIDAVVLGTVRCDPTLPVPNGPCDEVKLTVAQQSLRLTLGTGNSVIEPDTTRFQLPYSVLVTDANGSPQGDVTVNLSLFTLRYHKGVYVLTALIPPWRQQPTVSNCPNEDVNRNGRLDAGEDIDGNRVLNPPPAAAVLASVRTDAAGIANFNVVYLQDNATWFDVELEARTNVAGSESFTRAIFTLPGLASDYANAASSPPGVVSPNGTSVSCSIPN